MQERPRIFSEEIGFFTKKILAGENFGLVRFGDGEMRIVKGEAIDLSTKCHGEHKYAPGNERDEAQRTILRESLCFRADHYFVGIACRCCVGDEDFLWLKKESGQPESQLTWANVFVNSNYRIFTGKTVGAFEHRRISVVCHKRARPDQLPFPVARCYAVGGNSWVNDYARLKNVLADYIRSNAVKDEVFLFCAGVLSNMLVYVLAREFPDNTYIDMGSVFDDTMGLGRTRKYLRGRRKCLEKTCVW